MKRIIRIEKTNAPFTSYEVAFDTNTHILYHHTYLLLNMVTVAPQIIVSEDHQSQSFKKLSSLREKSELCDISLKVQDTTIRAHKVILAACSQYFNFMFTGNVTEHTKEEILLNDLQPEAVSALIEYVYSGVLVVTEENIVNILTTADFLQIKSAKLECLNFLLKIVRPSNCVKLKLLAKKYYFNEFEEKVNKFIRWNFAEVIKSRDFLQLPRDLVKDFLYDDSFDLSESSVAQGIGAWVRYKRVPRKNFKVDLEKVTEEHIRKLNRTSLNIYDSSRQKRIYITNRNANELEFSFYDLNNLTLHRLPSQKGFLPTLHNSSIFMLNTNDSYYAKYDLDEENWTLVQPFIIHMKLFGYHLPLSLQTTIGRRINYFKRTPFVENFYSGACSFNDRMYLIAYHSKRFYSYNVERNVLYSEPDLKHQRSYPGVACDEHCIYVCGGGTNAFERLDYRTNKWRSMACLPVESISPCTATSFENSIYCADDNGFFQFDKRIGSWIQKAHIPKSGYGCFPSISSTDDAVYAVNQHGLYKYSEVQNVWTTLMAKDLGIDPTCLCYVPQ